MLMLMNAWMMLVLMKCKCQMQCLTLGCYTCYSRLHWRWFRYMSPCYWTTWPSLVLAHFRFLMDYVSSPLLFHMFVFYWHTCRVAVGSRVIFSLDHVSYFYWSTWLFLIRPRVTVLSVHVSFFDSTTWLDDFLPHVGFLLAHVLCHGYFTCHALVRPCVKILFDHVAYLGSTKCSTINSS